MNDKRYGDFEMVNGATLNAANDRIKELESRLETALNGLRQCEEYVEAIEGMGLPARMAAIREITSPILFPVVEKQSTFCARCGSDQHELSEGRCHETPGYE